MKKLAATFFLIGLFLAATLFSIFYYWAKQPNLASDQYYVLETFPGQAKTTSDTIKIMTYNIGYLSGMTNNMPYKPERDLFDDNLKSFLSVLNNINPDIIGFQEIDFGSDRSYQVDQLQEIVDDLEYAASYRSVNWDVRYLPFPYWPPSVQFGKIESGQAIASRYSMSNPQTIVLEKPADAPFYYNTFYIDRLVQLVDLQIGDHTVKLMNLHLEAFEQDTRVLQAQKIKELFESYAQDYPVIMTGDFNSAPEYESVESEAMKVIMSAENIASCIRKSAYDVDPFKSYTFSSEKPEIMIDYILYNNNFLDCVGARRVDEAGQVSDHLPIVSNLVFLDEIDSTFQE